MGVLLDGEKIYKFLAVRRVGVMTLRECHVDLPFPDHVIRCWVRTRPPPPQNTLQKIPFGNLQYREIYMICTVFLHV
jgi:hypothetical protein